jgi:GTP-binding protein HflX
MEVDIPKGITISTQKAQERAVLLSVDTPGDNSKWSNEASIAELAALAYTAGANVVGKISQKLHSPSKTHYIGKGKLEELLKLKETLNFDTVIVDDELTAQQQQNMEEFLQTKVIDRVALILDIFARRARTHEGKLQVELAQCEYNLPRLTGKWSHLERLGAGIGTRGPGESQLETDKRIIKQKISRLKKQIEEVRQQRELYRQKRNRSGIPVISLVGYTNTGKSTLLNALSRSEVIARNELFSTLDPTTRKLTLPDKRTVLLTDTVGFIRRLPTTLIASFRATLEELAEADILIHVVDMTSHNAAEQCETVEAILKDLNIDSKPRITALNKIDLILSHDESWTEDKAIAHISSQGGFPEGNTVLISAAKKWGFNQLREMIVEMLNENISKTISTVKD